MGKQSAVVNEKHKDYCFFCGTYLINGSHHLIFGAALRELADEDGLHVPVCDNCHTMGNVLNRVHDNPMAEKLSKMLGQAIYERNKCAEGVTLDDAKESFRKRYGRSYW